MKLRNKKTGEISEFNDIYLTKTVKETNTVTRQYVERAFYSVSDLQDEFEDYEPAEPLIANKKIRKAVRAWWESVPDEVIDKRILYKANHDLAVGTYTIYCGTILPLGTLKEGKYYTITELCGDDKE